MQGKQVEDENNVKIIGNNSNCKIGYKLNE